MVQEAVPLRAEELRAQAKRHELVSAARAVFTAKGYLGTSMDAVAAQAGASKRTLYQYFTDKEQLFAAVVLETVDRGYEHFKPGNIALAEVEADQLESALCERARAALTGILAPEVLQMRRLVIAEAERFPEVGRQYYERSWGRTQALLTQSLATLNDRGLLRIDDAERAAYLFVWMAVAIPLNRTAFLGDAATYTSAEIEDLADEATRIFLAAYGQNP